MKITTRKKSKKLFGHLPQKQRIECLIAGWKAAAYGLRSQGRISEASQLEMCAETLAEIV